MVRWHGQSQGKGRIRESGKVKELRDAAVGRIFAGHSEVPKDSDKESGYRKNMEPGHLGGTVG